MPKKKQSSRSSPSDDRVAKLEAEVSSLRSRLTLATVLGVLVGSGGLFGLYKWVAIERSAQELAYHKTEMEMINAAFDAAAESYKRTQEQLDALASSERAPEGSKTAQPILDLEAKRRHEIQSKCALCHQDDDMNPPVAEEQPTKLHR